MKASIKTGFIGGCIGAIVLLTIMYIMKAAGMGEPGFIGMYRGMTHSNGASDPLIAGLLFVILGGGIWGIIFALLVKNPTLLKGLLFGILPTLWLWVVVNAMVGKPLFNGFDIMGLVMPLIFNMVIWGSILGWYCSREKATATL
ncbi:MAG: hypothetical protein LH478_15045 [Chitinophagaceae bacterium]|nr:hypothetical protein [Chitinophagaceae bacterium]